jgi:cytochrome c biogenesis protein CcmG, thiol:disulfide interchange protein DsbE
MSRRLAILALAPFASLLVVSWWLLSRPEPAPATFGSPVRPAPDITAASVDGPPFRFTEMKGRPYLVNFWASWCTPCRAEHPMLLEMAKQGVEIVGVMHKDRTELGLALLEKDGDPFSRVVLDPSGDVSLAVGISGVPETFLVDANGMIVKTMRGPIVDKSIMQSFIDAYRAELAKAAAPAPA